MINNDSKLFPGEDTDCATAFSGLITNLSQGNRLL